MARIAAGGWSLPERGGMLMVTYAELFQLCLVIIGIISLALKLKR